MKWFVFISLLFACSASACAAERDPTALTAAIDLHFENHWKQIQATAYVRADDAEFLRRVYLDLAGRIPMPTEVRDFLASSKPDKRERLIDTLLAQPGYATHFARVWCQQWLPQTAAQFDELKPEFEEWMRGQLRASTPYDVMVRDLIVAKGGPTSKRSAQVFLQANEYKPANLAGNTSRFFLGLNIDCAQCHDHPFAKWTKNQFWQSAAFFEDTNVSTKKEFAPRFIDGASPVFKDQTDAMARRRTYADWLTSPKNPYFARNAANRLWAMFLGSALAEPIDDLSDLSQAPHVKLLEQLGEGFAANGYDLPYLIRAILRSKVYQLSSKRSDHESAAGTFLSFAMRSMNGDQLFDSLVIASGIEAEELDRKAFLLRFGNPEKPSETGRSLLQAMALMNGEGTTLATSLNSRGTLTAVVNAPHLDTRGRIEALYLATLSRLPTKEELRRVEARIVKDPDAKRTLSSLFWALLNSQEFSTIH